MAFSKQFEGKVVAITGGASGIGLATAHLLASRGAKLSLVDLSEDALSKHAEDIQKTHNVEVMTLKLDVRNASQVDQWVKQVKDRFGQLDGCANLAGVIPKSIGLKGVNEQDEDEWNFVLGVNLTGVMHCMRAQLNALGSGGAIVNASSIAGVTGNPNNGSYTASKHGVVGLTRSAAKEMGSKNVRVNCICPGKIKTPMVAEAASIVGEDRMADTTGIALGRAGQPEEVAKLIAFLLSDESSYISGAAIAIDGGWNC